MENTTANSKGTVIIGIGDFHLGSDTMSSIGLGSCVGLVIHDREKGIGGLAHVMLPDSGGRKDRPGKFADTAVVALVDGLVEMGCQKSRMIAKIAGGAAMFKTFTGNLNIGERNIAALKENLKSINIPLKAECVGGSVGRTIIYHPSDGGKLIIRQADGERSEI